MSKQMILSLAGSAMRKALVYAIAKWGVSAVIGDADVSAVVDAVLAIGVVVWGCIEKRKALNAQPATTAPVTEAAK